jgi:hypothetical protein
VVDDPAGGITLPPMAAAADRQEVKARRADGSEAEEAPRAVKILVIHVGGCGCQHKERRGLVTNMEPEPLTLLSPPKYCYDRDCQHAQ